MICGTVLATFSNPAWKTYVVRQFLQLHDNHLLDYWPLSVFILDLSNVHAKQPKTASEHPLLEIRSACPNLEKNSTMPTESCRNFANRKHNAFLDILQSLANQFPAHVQITLLHRKIAPSVQHNQKVRNREKSSINKQRRMLTPTPYRPQQVFRAFPLTPTYFQKQNTIPVPYFVAP